MPRAARKVEPPGTRPTVLVEREPGTGATGSCFCERVAQVVEDAVRHGRGTAIRRPITFRLGISSRDARHTGIA
jgi:hypothetical protein